MTETPMQVTSPTRSSWTPDGGSAATIPEDFFVERKPAIQIRVGPGFGIYETKSGAVPFSWKAIADEQTNSGFIETATFPKSEDSIAELRELSGLTWDQLARLFGVARRSLHFWASGKPMNAANLERLGKLLSVIRFINRGDSAATRAALLESGADSQTSFELLAEGEFDEVRSRVGAGAKRPEITLLPLSAAAKESRKPLTPTELAGAEHDAVHEHLTRSRAGRASKSQK